MSLPRSSSAVACVITLLVTVALGLLVRQLPEQRESSFSVLGSGHAAADDCVWITSGKTVERYCLTEEPCPDRHLAAPPSAFGVEPSGRHAFAALGVSAFRFADCQDAEPLNTGLRTLGQYLLPIDSKRAIVTGVEGSSAAQPSAFEVEWGKAPVPIEIELRIAEALIRDERVPIVAPVALLESHLHAIHDLGNERLAIIARQHGTPGVFVFSRATPGTAAKLLKTIDGNFVASGVSADGELAWVATSTSVAAVALSSPDSSDTWHLSVRALAVERDQALVLDESDNLYLLRRNHSNARPVPVKQQGITNVASIRGHFYFTNSNAVFELTDTSQTTPQTKLVFNQAATPIGGSPDAGLWLQRAETIEFFRAESLWRGPLRKTSINSIFIAGLVLAFLFLVEFERLVLKATRTWAAAIWIPICLFVGSPAHDAWPEVIPELVAATPLALALALTLTLPELGPYREMLARIPGLAALVELAVMQPALRRWIFAPYIEHLKRKMSHPARAVDAKTSELIIEFYTHARAPIPVIIEFTDDLSDDALAPIRWALGTYAFSDEILKRQLGTDLIVCIIEDGPRVERYRERLRRTVEAEPRMIVVPATGDAPRDSAEGSSTEGTVAPRSSAREKDAQEPQSEDVSPSQKSAE